MAGGAHFGREWIIAHLGRSPGLRGARGRGRRDRDHDRHPSPLRHRRMPPAIPSTAPFAEDEIEALNRIVGRATPTQRAWLAGFLAGLEASGVEEQAAVPAVAPIPAEPLTILYATESGNAEKLAGDLAK